MELDPTTKWLIRISSSIIIAFGAIIILVIPLLALKVTSIISLTQDTILTEFKDILTGLLTML